MLKTTEGIATRKKQAHETEESGYIVQRLENDFERKKKTRRQVAETTTATVPRLRVDMTELMSSGYDYDRQKEVLNRLVRLRTPKTQICSLARLQNAKITDEGLRSVSTGFSKGAHENENMSCTAERIATRNIFPGSCRRVLLMCQKARETGSLHP
ncbi:hypothetical protein EDC04DRAFT_2629294, partial [Pisolithus marmoratus]